ncbi:MULTISPECIES: hypothetical protein [unclassified Roseateles]|uniref:hypothetical protein n=1 Tax=Pelomonas sp. Root1237 TaxID=1736434 RepID=UPI0006F51D01|nr:hypothetical protein [Pelomonas sp. Root1237]KQV85745.1 hypothetical protein ASC91_24275 [Pelomonas sp. Root1237]
MKALVLAAVLAALSSSTPAGATREARQPIVDTTTATVIADAGRLGSASLTSFNGNAHWTPANRQAETEFDALPAEVDTGSLLIVLGALALAVARPVSRALRRQEQQRRAAALASTLAHTPR